MVPHRQHCRISMGIHATLPVVLKLVFRRRTLLEERADHTDGAGDAVEVGGGRGGGCVGRETAGERGLWDTTRCGTAYTEAIKAIERFCDGATDVAAYFIVQKSLRRDGHKCRQRKLSKNSQRVSLANAGA